jgi:hypothetical protein
MARSPNSTPRTWIFIMSTIVDFRRRREEAADARLIPAAQEAAPGAQAGGHIAEIILFPRKERAARKAKRKAMKRRFAPKPAASAMS